MFGELGVDRSDRHGRIRSNRGRLRGGLPVGEVLLACTTKPEQSKRKARWENDQAETRIPFKLIYHQAFSIYPDYSYHQYPHDHIPKCLNSLSHFSAASTLLTTDNTNGISLAAKQHVGHSICTDMRNKFDTSRTCRGGKEDHIFGRRFLPESGKSSQQLLIQ